MKTLDQLYAHYLSAAQMAKIHAGTPSERQWQHIAAQKRLKEYQYAKTGTPAGLLPTPAIIEA